MTDADTNRAATEQTTVAATDRSKGMTLLVAGLSVALVAALVGLVLSWRALDAERDELDRREAAVEDARDAATDATIRMSSYDYRSLDEDFAWLDEVGTDKFRKDFGPAVESLKKTIAELRSHADAEVMRAAAELRGDSKAVVLLFVDQMLSDDTGDISRELSRVEMDMVLEDGEWLVDSLTTFNPASTLPVQ